MTDQLKCMDSAKAFRNFCELPDTSSGLQDCGGIANDTKRFYKNSSLSESDSQKTKSKKTNTAVYALVEVSKDPDKPIREKIPLNTKDFYQMIQKVVDGNKEKMDRKILRPSLKRKYNAENNTKMIEGKQLLNNKLTSVTLGKLGKINITCKYSNNNSAERHRKCEHRESCIKERTERNTNVKVLYDRKAICGECDESRPNIKNVSTTRGTNTDIVQTPKLLEDALQLLKTKFEFSCSGKKALINRCEASSTVLSEKSVDQTRNYQTLDNLFLVPFIVTNKCLQVSKRSNSCESIQRDEHNCLGCISSVECKDPKTARSHDSFTKGRRTGNDPTEVQKHLPISTNTFAEDAILNKSSQSDVQKIRGEYFLKEVKILQMKLNSIIKGLEANNIVSPKRSYSVLNNEKDEQTTKTAKSTAVEHHLNTIKSLLKQSDACKDAVPERAENRKNYQDFCVQVSLVKQASIAVESIKASRSDTLNLIKPPQTPEEMKAKSWDRYVSNRALPSKSTPLFQIPDNRAIKSKRTESLPSIAKTTPTGDFLSLKLSLKFEGSRPDNGDQFEDWEIVKQHEKSKTGYDIGGTEKKTDILYKKKNFTVVYESENSVLINMEANGKLNQTNIVAVCSNSERTEDVILCDVKPMNDIGRKSDECVNGKNTKAVDAKTKPKIVKKPVTEKTAAVDAKKPSMPKENRNKYVNKTQDVAPAKETKPSKLKKPMTPVRGAVRPKENAVEVKKKPAKQEKVDALKMKKTHKEVSKVEVEPLRKSTDESHVEKEDAESCVSGKSKKVEEKTGNVDLALYDEAIMDMARNTSAYNRSVNSGIMKVEEVLPTKKKSSSENQALKSIWALTKVILYKDGSQSFEVLEASSTPPGYFLQQPKRDSNDNIGNSDNCQTDAQSIINNTKEEKS